MISANDLDENAGGTLAREGVSTAASSGLVSPVQLTPLQLRAIRQLAFVYPEMQGPEHDELYFNDEEYRDEADEFYQAFLGDMLGVRLLVVADYENGAANLAHALGRRLSKRKLTVYQGGLLPWLGPAFVRALREWKQETESDAIEAIEAILGRMEEEAIFRTAAGFRSLDPILSGREPESAIHPQVHPPECDQRPPPTVLLTAGGRDFTHVPLN